MTKPIRACKDCRWWKEPDLENNIGICDLVGCPCMGEYWCSGFQRKDK